MGKFKVNDRVRVHSVTVGEDCLAEVILVYKPLLIYKSKDGLSNKYVQNYQVKILKNDNFYSRSIMTFREKELSLDKQYFRDKRLNQILNEN